LLVGHVTLRNLYLDAHGQITTKQTAARAAHFKRLFFPFLVGVTRKNFFSGAQKKKKTMSSVRQNSPQSGIFCVSNEKLNFDCFFNISIRRLLFCVDVAVGNGNKVQEIAGGKI
jgi:hypothetical protein